MDSLKSQVRKSSRIRQSPEEFVKEGDMSRIISTGSTLLDLAVSGGSVRGGGIPAGIFVEIFGPAGSGKTVMLSEIAGNVQRKGGRVMFHDPEARLDKQFASVFGLDSENMEYESPDTVTELFSGVRNWDPEPENMVHGIFADSLAALSTNMEMENEEGDKMGMRRAKEFSESLRKTCRLIKQKNYLMVCSNQIRIDMNAGPYGAKYQSPGGQSIGFYSSLRLRVHGVKKLKKVMKVKGKEISRVQGIEAQIEVFKNSVWKPFRTEPVSIIYDYGIDDVRENLKFLKKYSGATVYVLGDRKLHRDISSAVQIVEEEELENDLKSEVISLWESMEKGFREERKSKKRD